MGTSVNKVILIGRLGKDPEIRFTPNGRAVTNFTLATDESWTDQNNERQEKTEWHRVITWGKAAEHAAKYFAKGKLVYIEGRLQSRSWEDKDGNKRYVTEIVANTFKGLSKEDKASEDLAPPTREEGNNVQNYNEFDDVPF